MADLDLTTIPGVRALMESSSSAEEWKANAAKVSAANDGFPSFWRSLIVMSGLADRVAATWRSKAECKVVVAWKRRGK